MRKCLLSASDFDISGGKVTNSQPQGTMKSRLFSPALALCIVPQFCAAAIRLVITTQNYLPDGVTVAPGSLLQALQMAGAGDTITFAIPGPGPHVIQTPLGGYPL